MATVNGTVGNDQLSGTSAANQISGAGGADTLSGLGGADTMSGGTGADVIEGGDGADQIFGGGGNDYLAGQDLSDPAGSASSGNLNPSITSDDGAADYIEGGDGNDTLLGGGGNDVLAGGTGDDFIAGGTGADAIVGGLGADTILGGDGDDSISGDDSIYNLPSAAFGGGGSILQVNQITSGAQTPPITLVLDDGRVFHAWADASGVLQGRLFEAGGAPATDQFSLSSQWRLSATDTFDWSNLDVDQLADGTVMLSYVRAAADGGEEPVFSIVNPDVDPADAGFVVRSNVEIQNADDTAIESPPVTTVLDNGNVLFIWSENAALDDTTTMILRGRIYDPTSQTWMTADFRIGTQAIDGSAFDNDNLTVTQLTGGNIVVGYVRSNAETGFSEPVYTVLNPAGNVVRALSEIEGQDTETQATALESPPLIVALDGDRWMAVWSNDGLSDDVATMRLEGRIFNGDGTPATNDFPISNNALEGFDGYDNANFTAVTLSNGNIVIGYAESDITAGDGSNLPHFTIVSGLDGSQIAIDRAIAQSPDHIWGGPPVIAALGGGHFVAVFADGNQASGGVTGLTYRIFDANGVALTGDVQLTTALSTTGLHGTGGFDWNYLNVVYNPTNNSFVVNWVGNSDGNGTGVYTSGPIAGPGGLTVPAIDPTAGGADFIDGGAGADTISGAGGNDTLSGGAGNDRLFGGAGDDRLSGDAGADTLEGGAGNDILFVGEGDLANGGAGDDQFTLVDSGEPGAGSVTVAGGDGRDILDLGGIAQPGTVVRTGDSTTGFNGTVTLLDGSLVHFTGMEAVICFVKGTQIMTPMGEKRVETLTKGDIVNTADGPQPIRWIGHRHLDRARLATTPKLCPVLIPAGALGAGMPVRNLVVSPQHRMLIANRVAERMFDARAVLVPAKDLVGSSGIRYLTEAQDVTYFHLLFDRHHVVQADGAWAESLFPGPEALKGLPSESQSEILSLFPQLACLPVDHCFVPAHPFQRGAKVRKMIERLKSKGRALVDVTLLSNMPKTMRYAG